VNLISYDIGPSTIPFSILKIPPCSFYVGDIELCVDASFAAQSCREREEPLHRECCWMGNALHELQPGLGA
jgi:hypothetical protein